MRTAAKYTLFLSLLLPLICFGQQADRTAEQSDQLPTFRKNVDVVNVFFTVKDKHGALVPSLPKDEFDLYEDGKPQKIKYFAAETNLPLTLGLLVDSSGSMQRMLEEEKIVAADFLRQVVTEKDLAFIISFDISVDLLQDLTSDVHLLNAGLQKAKINIGGGGGGIPGLGQGPVPIARPKGTLLNDGVYLASSEVLAKQVGRKAMVVLSDGEDEGSTYKLRDAIEAAQRADAICYVLLLHDPQFPAGSGEMRQLAESTGGRMIEVNNPRKIGDAFRQISAELRSQYSLGYTPENDKHDGTFRKIEIRSKSGNKVQARKGYYAQIGKP
jgi:VWFA-related protein